MKKEIIIGVLVIVIIGAGAMWYFNKESKGVGETSREISSSNDCEGACSNYTMKCLSLVPNADQNLFNEGLKSCVAECAKWKKEKVECILQASDCPAMTETCGL